jgi:hypothetical protein
VWQSVVNGQTLNFELAGINNQNFIMRDTQTGSWWQQISGEAIQGPLRGQKLAPVESDELSFAIWKRENPNGRVLRPETGKIESADWEQQVAKMPVRINARIEDTFPPRTLMIGLKINDQAKAYPFSALEKQNPIVDTVGGTDIILLLAEDKKSVRVFERIVEGKKLELLRKPETAELIDTETGSSWDFSGRAVSGELTGKQLRKIPAIKDYWFDWQTYNPETLVYRLGNQ